MSHNSNFINTWNEILEGIEHVYRLAPMTTKRYMELHTLVYDYCSNTNNLSTHARPKKIQKVTHTPEDGQIVGKDLYMNIKNYLTNYLNEICQNGIDLQGHDVLHFYTDQWHQYTSPSKVVNGFCSYLNIHWIKRAIDSKETDIYNILPLTMKIWENVVFTLLNKQVTQACFDLIKAERNKQVINTNLISKVIQSYVALGISPDTTQPIIYQKYFEAQFLLNTEQFYLLEAVTFLQHNSVTEYIRKVFQRLDEEVHRVQSYLHPSTLQPLIKKVEDVLIRDQLDILYKESKILLQNDNYQDLIILFKLISRIPNALDHLRDIVENHIYQVGLDAIERIKETAVNNPKNYIETILDVHKKLLKLVEDVFNRKQDFIAALDRACAKFINKNAVTIVTGNATKSPELLARYCDVLLRKGNRGVEENAFEEKLTDILAIFNYMEDKDVFEKFYRNRLAKRLVAQLSASDDHEEFIISKLKELCGYEYTLKLQRMFQDMTLSKNISTQYRTYCENRQLTDIDFSVMVLTYNSWPFSAPPNLVLPSEIKQLIDSFTNFYTLQHSGRKLMWLYQHSMGEVQTLFTKPKYIFQVSTYQMNVLLLFNEQTTWIVEQIQDKTQIHYDILLQVLLAFLKIKLLTCENININDNLNENDIKVNYAIKLSDTFKSKNIKINLNVPLKVIEQKDNENVQRTIEDDRKLLIQAALVRIMKTRQTLKHALLMQEVIQQLSSRFKPKIPDIKKNIDILIEKEYFERHANERDMLRYLA